MDMKPKKNKKKWIILIICILALLLGAASFLLYQRNEAAAKTSTNEAIAGENQTLVTVSIQKMIGNEMTGVSISDETELQEAQTWMIPVGTEVVTKLGTITTFARLASGDQVQVLFDDQTQEILKIWITQ